MSRSSGPRIAVCFHRLGPYHHARLRAVAARPSADVWAVEFSASGGAYKWDYVPGADQFQRVTLFAHAASAARDRSEATIRVQQALDAIRPEVVAVSGWSQPLSLVVLRHCLRRRWPAVVMSESARDDMSRRWWREAVKRRIVQLYSGALVGGARHRQYLCELGIAADEIEDGYDVVDNDQFADAAHRTRERADEWRCRFALPDRFFLASARFVEKKNLPGLLEAYAIYRSRTAPRSEPWKLVLLGDGPLREHILGSIHARGLATEVLLPGFIQYQALPRYYGLAGAFVHPSTTEQWGLVVNEAMAAGLPVIVSRRCGCAPDLVQEAVNGFTFDPEDPAGLAQLLARVADLGLREREEMGRMSQKIIGAWSPDRFADGLLASTRRALKVGARQPGWAHGALLWTLSRWMYQP